MYGEDTRAETGFVQVQVAQAAVGQAAHFPDVVRLHDGRLLAVYREGAGHVRSDGRICAVESDDDGRTWSVPRVVVDGPHDDRDPKIMQTRDGAVLLNYFVIDWSTRPRHTFLGTYVVRSDDGGRSWDEPVPVGGSADPGVLGRACSHGAAVELPSGALLLPVYGVAPGDARDQALVVRSTDGGRSWPAEHVVVLAASDDMHFHEPTLTVLDEERIVALLRTTVGYAYLSRSQDGGRTWSDPTATDLPASSHHVLPLADGGLLITYGDLSGRFSARRATTGRLVPDACGDWNGHPDVAIYDSGDDDQANPSSAELAPGRFLTLSFDVRAGTVVGVFTESADYRPAG